MVGFVNSENTGAVGLEAKYNDVLEGTAGMTVTAKNGVGTEMLFDYEQIFDAENGNSLVLTLDVEVQSYLEKGLESMVEKYDAAGGGTGIIMNVNTGAIVAMASYPNYDLNSPGTIQDGRSRSSWTRPWRTWRPTGGTMRRRRSTRRRWARPRATPSTASGATSASTPPMSPAPPTSPSPWPWPSRRGW